MADKYALLIGTSEYDEVRLARSGEALWARLLPPDSALTTDTHDARDGTDGFVSGTTARRDL